MYNVIIWGTGNCYNRHFNSIKLQELQGFIRVLAITSDDENIKFSQDGYIFLPEEEAFQLEYDYCLVAIDDGKHIYEKAIRMGALREKLIPLRVFSVPYFDFKKYVAIKESRVSIISRNCWGGMVYHYLGLEFLTPTINLSFRTEFNRFVKKLDYYLSLPVEFIRMETDLNNHEYPVGKVDDIEIFFKHYRDFTSAIESWEIRKKRINKDNILIISNTKSEDEAIEFDELPYKHKLIFVPFENNLKSNFYVANTERPDELSYPRLLNRYAIGERRSLFNLFALLNHEDSFSRIN